MFTVASVLALVGLVSLIIPVLIHLFNPGKGRLVWVGNIELVRLAKKKAVTERRITRWLLLLFRLLIFVIITLLLANTFWQGEIKGSAKNLALVSPQWLEQASEQQQKTIWSSADEVKLLDKNVNYWTYLAWLDERRPANETFDVYTTNNLDRFDTATKSQLKHDTTWHTLPAQHEPAKLIGKAVVEKTAVVYADTPNKYLNAALNTIKSQRLSGLTIMQAGEENGQSADWVFWLHQKPLPDQLKSRAAQGSIVIAYHSGPLKRQLWGDGLIYHMPPDWGGLVTEADFPNRLLDLMNALRPITTRFIDATLSPQQIETSKRPVEADEQKRTPLHSGLLLLLVMCWIIERYLAERPDSNEAAQ